jgi:hypothetical protein
MAGQNALLVLANFWKRSSRDFLSDFGAQSDKNVSRENFGPIGGRVDHTLAKRENCRLDEIFCLVREEGAVALTRRV